MPTIANPNNHPHCFGPYAGKRAVGEEEEENEMI
jgi:hypothetical protein